LILPYQPDMDNFKTRFPATWEKSALREVRQIVIQINWLIERFQDHSGSD